MCGTCKVKDRLSIYDRKCFSCEPGKDLNPYYEPYGKALSKYTWICQNADCSSLNFLPETSCRNCYETNECMIEVKKNCQTFAKSEKYTCQTFWRCKNTTCRAINDSEIDIKCCRQCYQIKDLTIKPEAAQPLPTRAAKASRGPQFYYLVKYCLICDMKVEKVLINEQNQEQAAKLRREVDGILVCRECFGVELEDRIEKM